MKRGEIGTLGSAAILSIGILLYTDSIVQTALGAISIAFPEVPLETVKLLQSITPLIMVLSALACGRLARYFPKKKILIAGIILILVGGLAPAIYVSSFSYLLVMKAVFSVGYGLCSPLAAATLVDAVEPGPIRDRLAGQRQAVGGIASVVFAALAGLGAGVHFRWAYAVYLLIIPVLLLIWRGLPEDGVRQSMALSKDRVKLPLSVWGVALGNVLVNIMLYAFFSSVSIVIVQSGAGTSVQAGLTISIFSACVCVTGLLFSILRRYLKRYLLSVALLSLAVCFFVLRAARGFPFYILGSILFGFGFAIYTPELQLLVADLLTSAGMEASPSASATAYSLLIVAQSVGQGISTKVLAGLAKALNISGLKAGWSIAAAGLILLTLGAAVIAWRYERQLKAGGLFRD